MLRELLAEVGPDPELNGLLGRVYKDRWSDGGMTPELLDQAVETYLDGHEADPDDPYPGINALTMMALKIAALLKAAGIITYARLSTVDVERIQSILDQGGPQYNLADPESWPRQASLAAAGRWGVLEVLQDELKGGRQVT